jgi:hypothetical protein
MIDFVQGIGSLDFAGGTSNNTANSSTEGLTATSLESPNGTVESANTPVAFGNTARPFYGNSAASTVAAQAVGL